MSRGHEDHPLVELFTEPDAFVPRVRDYAGDVIAASTPWLALSAAVVLLAGAPLVAARYWRARRLADGARRIRILAPPQVAPPGALTLWMGLHAILRPAWRRFLSGQPHLAWEVVAEADSISFSLWVQRAIPPGLVERAIESAWPGAKTEIGADVALLALPGHVAITELTLAEPDWFPSDRSSTPSRCDSPSGTARARHRRAGRDSSARPATSAARYRLLRRRATSSELGPRPFRSGRAARARARHPPPVPPWTPPSIPTSGRYWPASSPLWRCAVRVGRDVSPPATRKGKDPRLAGAFAVFEGRNGFRPQQDACRTETPG